jgi:Putative zinc-finger
MNSSDQRFAGHREAWELIPWVVNGTASEAEQALVHKHLVACPDCAGELRFQSELHAAVQGRKTPITDAAVPFLRLSHRLDRAPAAAPLHLRGFAAFTGRRALLAVVALETVGLLVLSTAQWVRGPMPGTAVYRTLGAGAEVPRPATIRLVLDPSASIGDVQTMLAQLRLRIVDGPSAAGVFSLAPEGGAASLGTAQSVRLLRGRPAVRFAEPTDGDAERR